MPSQEETLVAAASDLLREVPSGLSRADLGRGLAERFPDAAPAHLGFAARLLCPVVQAADPTVWNPGRTRYVLAEHVLPRRALDDPESGRSDLLRSYLRAFGPATAADVTAWSGLTHLAPALRNLEGVKVRNEMGREVFEMPGCQREPRPAFVLPEFDNVFFCRRPPDPATAEAKRRLLPNPAGLMRGAVVADGEVRAAWWREAGTDRLHLEEWEPLDRAAADEFDAFRESYGATSQGVGALD